MRCTLQRLLIVSAGFAPHAYGDDADVSALQQLLEQQSRLLAEQSQLIEEQAAELRRLQQRMAQMEARLPVVARVPVEILDPASDAVEVPVSARTEAEPRVAAIEAGEIALQQKSPLRTGRETQITDSAAVLTENVDLYGSMRLFTELGAGNPTLNDGSSRLGLRLGREFRDRMALFGRVEWKVNLVDNDSELFTFDSGGGGGIVTRSEQTEDALTTRLGYLGARFDGIGEVSFGKQWSVYYDVAGWTDNFNIYGGRGLSVFPAGTDGGVVGSGRADNAIVFRNERGRFSYGLQTQLKTSTDDNDYTGFGGSMIVSPTPEWDVGLAVTGARVEGDFERITGEEETGAVTLGLRYNSGPWNVAVAAAAWVNHEAVFLEDDTVIYDGYGAEMFASYAVSQRLNVYGGFNYSDPDVDDPRIDPDFGDRILILGVSFFDSRDSFAYIEGLLSDGKQATGTEIDSVISAGYRFDW